jgi:hypothetical protein
VPEPGTNGVGAHVGEAQIPQVAGGCSHRRARASRGVRGGTANIGASDAYLSSGDMVTNPSLLNVPLAISAQQVNYNLPHLKAGVHVRLGWVTPGWVTPGWAPAKADHARDEVEPARLAELARPVSAALRAGCRRRPGSGRARSCPCTRTRCRAADAHPAYIAEISARALVATTSTTLASSPGGVLVARLLGEHHRPAQFCRCRVVVALLACLQAFLDHLREFGLPGVVGDVLVDPRGQLLVLGPDRPRRRTRRIPMFLKVLGRRRTQAIQDLRDQVGAGRSPNRRRRPGWTQWLNCGMPTPLIVVEMPRTLALRSLQVRKLNATVVPRRSFGGKIFSSVAWAG